MRTSSQIENPKTAAIARQELSEFGTLFDNPDPRCVAFAVVDPDGSGLREKGNVVGTRNSGGRGSATHSAGCFSAPAGAK